MVRFRVVHNLSLGSQYDVKWRAYSPNGKTFECGNSTRTLRERNERSISYETSSSEFRIFAWMARLQHGGRDRPFVPTQILPIPTTVLDEDGDEVDDFEAVYTFDDHTSCQSSHMVVWITNNTPSHAFMVKVGAYNWSELILPMTFEREVAFAIPETHCDSPTRVGDVANKTSIVAGSTVVPVAISCNGQTVIVLNVTNGETITIDMCTPMVLGLDSEFVFSRTPMSCPFPDNDVAIRVINRSGEDTAIQVVRSEFGDTLQTGILASETQRILWTYWHPSHIIWTTPSCPEQQFVPYHSGITITIRTPQALQAVKLLQQAEHNSHANEFVELLEQAGELERTGPIFADHLVEFRQLPLLNDMDWYQLGIKVGSKLRIQECLKVGSYSTRPSFSRTGSYSTVSDNSFEYDLFLSHRHEGGEDLAQAIKLQLQVMFPDHNLRIFLDVDNLRDLAKLRQHVRDSRNFLLLLTPGALDRPFIQSEVQTALGAKKNILLVHDIKKCAFPDVSTLPEAIRPVLERISIPYYRDISFRETAIRQIGQAMGLIEEDST